MKTKITIAILISVMKLSAQNNSIFFGGSSDGFATSSVGTGAEVPLPVEFLYFKAEVTNENQVNLTWSTALEFNNNYFVIQRSTGEYNFSDIGTVSGSGTSTIVNRYAFIDTDPHPGTSFYRLKQVDYNGTFSYTGIIEVEIGKNNEASNVLYDMLGNIVINPAAGIYISKNRSQTNKVMIK